MDCPEQYAQVIIETPGMRPLDYLIPEGEMVAVGDRVIVPVQYQKKAGIVVAVRDWTEIAGRRLKKLARLLDGIPPLSSEWLGFTRFAAEYYCRSWGEVALPAIPAFFRKRPGVRQAASLAKLRTLPDIKSSGKVDFNLLRLNPAQQQVVDQVIAAQDFVPWLLFGVTGSGKTEVYLHIMSKILEKDPESQILLLVPEINLTPQLEARVRGHFPRDRVVTLNSELSPAERARAWLAIHEARARILVGTRMAVFASFRHLSLIIVDEEHDLSYKAGDGSRYSARDLAVKRAHDLRIPVVLGSATPSLESWAQARRGRYRLLELSCRAVPTASLPRLEFVDPGRKHEELIGQSIQDEISKTLKEGGQVLVFLNKRGYSPVLFCPACGWLSDCPHCSAKMVFHKDVHRLICHHCGFSRPVPARCPVCGATDILPVGAGTQRIEEELRKKWPEARILRIDRDNFHTKGASEKAFREVHAGKVDILLGTQMIAKGHDFQNVSLVVIFGADAQLVSTDIRAKERLFATLLQVAGRAGRAKQGARVMVMTRFPGDGLFSYLKRQDYSGFADALLEERKSAGAPPFVYQALYTAEHEDLNQAMTCLKILMESGLKLLEQEFSQAEIAIYDPVPMALVRVANKNRAQLLIESPSRQALHAFVRAIPLPRFAGGNVMLEIDPQRI